MKKSNTNNEIWKKIEGFEDYEISNMGRVKSLPRKGKRQEKLLNLKQRKDGYVEVFLTKNNKQYCFRVHRLVADAYIPNKSKFKHTLEENIESIDLNKLQINHKNEIKNDNKVENLEWCSKKYNANYGTRNKKIGEKMKIINKGKHYSPRTEFKKGDNAKSIKCIELNKIFNSITEASLELNICAGNITNVCKHKKNNKTAGGYHFEYE